MIAEDKLVHEYDQEIIANERKVINCKACGYWHVYPIPTSDELDHYYEEIYYQNSKEHGDMADKNQDPDGYYRVKYFDKLYDFNKLINKEGQKSILDLGAGFGDFLSFMKEQGWKTRGLEPASESFTQTIHAECNIEQGSLDDVAKFNFGVHDAIAMNTVLEHYPYPEQLLEYIRDHLMDENSILHIEVPNDFSFLQKVLNASCNDKKYWLCPLGHLNYWTHETLISLVERLGFTVEINESTFPLELLAVTGDDYISHPEKGRAMHHKRVGFEKKMFESGNIDLKLELYQKFAQIGLGREVLLYCKKK